MDGGIVCTKYMPNSGNPVPLIREFLQEVYSRFPKAKICAAAATGYGEDIIKNAFSVDYGIVETMAHFYAARAFNPRSISSSTSAVRTSSVSRSKTASSTIFSSTRLVPLAAARSSRRLRVRWVTPLKILQSSVCLRIARSTSAPAARCL